jgi:hypothetical protein
MQIVENLKSKKSITSMSFDDFPNEILHQVCTWLTEKNLIALLHVDHRLNDAATKVLTTAPEFLPAMYPGLVDAFEQEEYYQIKRAIDLGIIDNQDLARFEGFIKHANKFWALESEPGCVLDSHYVAGLAEAGEHTEVEIDAETGAEGTIDYIEKFPIAVLAGAIRAENWELVDKTLIYLENLIDAAEDPEIFGRIMNNGYISMDEFLHVFINDKSKLLIFDRLLDLNEALYSLDDFDAGFDLEYFGGLIIKNLIKTKTEPWTEEKNKWFERCSSQAAGHYGYRDLIYSLQESINLENYEMFRAIRKYCNIPDIDAFIEGQKNPGRAHTYFATWDASGEEEDENAIYIFAEYDPEEEVDEINSDDGDTIFLPIPRTMPTKNSGEYPGLKQ